MKTFNSIATIFTTISLLLLHNMQCDAQLSSTFYDATCPKASTLILNSIRGAISRDRRMAASFVRLNFHDCFVQGCDASILLDEAPSILSEKIAVPDNNSIRGSDVIEAAKHEVERACPGVVSYAEIYASVYVGGPSWTVRLGRRDSTTASCDQANTDLPSTFASLDVQISSFVSKGLSARDMVALSGPLGFRGIGFSPNLISKNLLQGQVILHCRETGFEKLEQDSILGQPNTTVIP
ncbi:hypothetical protein OROHE_004676 [Orobanche hederae]